MRQRFNTAKAETESPTVCLGSCIMNTDQCQVPHYTYQNAAIGSVSTTLRLIPVSTRTYCSLLQLMNFTLKAGVTFKLKRVVNLFSIRMESLYTTLWYLVEEVLLLGFQFYERETVCMRERDILKERECEKKEREVQRAKYEKGKKEYGAK